MYGNALMQRCTLSTFFVELQVCFECMLSIITSLQQQLSKVETYKEIQLCIQTLSASAIFLLESLALDFTGDETSAHNS